MVPNSNPVISLDLVRGLIWHKSITPISLCFSRYRSIIDTDDIDTNDLTSRHFIDAASANVSPLEPLQNILIAYSKTTSFGLVKKQSTKFGEIG